MTQRHGLSLLCLPLLALQLRGADGPTPTVDDLQKLREQIAKQQEEIKRLEQSLEQQQKTLDTALAAMTAAPVTAANRPWGGQHAETAPAPLSPFSVSLGRAELTPFAFMDATFFARSTNVGSGIGTNFMGIPFNSAVAGKLSETNFSAQNSRIGFQVDSTVLGAKVLGYLEADFLFNNNANSYQVTSNSAGLRLRNYFVDVQKNAFEVMAGQDWSLLTPNRRGLSPIPTDIFYTQDMDTNYQLGLVWTRQPQFRFIAHPSEDFAFGVSIENPQQYIGGGSGASTVAIPANLSATLASEYNSAQTATAVPNLFPDIIMKAAYDGHLGDKSEHVEVAGLLSGFKDYVPAAITTAIPGTHTAVGYAGEVNFNLELTKNFHLISNNFFSDGGGRYIFGTAPDFVVRPDGSLSPVHASSTVDGFEAQLTANTLIGMYYGGVYVGKNIILDNTASDSTIAKPIYAGYGYPGSTSYRDGQEITFDWVQTLWKNRNYGALSLINQYSYLMKEPWVIPAAGPKQAHSNLIYVDLRYTLP